MLKHKKNCPDNQAIIQHRFMEGVNGDRRVLHRLYCPNCKNSCTLSPDEALEIMATIYPDITTEQWSQIKAGGIININVKPQAQ